MPPSDPFRRRGGVHRSLSRLTTQALSTEAIWSLPLLLLGGFGLLQPIAVGTAVGLALVPWGVRFLLSGRSMRRVPFAGPLALLALGGFIGTWVTYDPASGWPVLLSLLGSVGLFLAVADGSPPPWRVGEALSVLASLVAAYTLLPGSRFDAGDGFLEAFVPLGLMLAWRARGWRRLAWGGMTAVLLGGLLLSGSLGSWIGLLAAGGIWGLQHVRRQALRRALAGIGGAATLLVLYALSHLAPIGQTLPPFSPVQQATASRLDLFRNGLYLLGDYPFTGIGLGDTFALAYSRYQLLIPVLFLSSPHNLFLSVGLGTGVVGLAAMFWLLGTFYRFVARRESAGRGRPLLALFRAAWLGATAAVVHGGVDVPSLAALPWAMPMGFALIGLVVATGALALRRINGGRARTKRRGWILLAAVVLVVAVLLILQRPLIGVGREYRINHPDG